MRVVYEKWIVEADTQFSEPFFILLRELCPNTLITIHKGDEKGVVYIWQIKTLSEWKNG